MDTLRVKLRRALINDENVNENPDMEEFISSLLRYLGYDDGKKYIIGSFYKNNYLSKKSILSLDNDENPLLITLIGGPLELVKEFVDIENMIKYVIRIDIKKMKLQIFDSKVDLIYEDDIKDDIMLENKVNNINQVLKFELVK